MLQWWRQIYHFVKQFKQTLFDCKCPNWEALFYLIGYIMRIILSVIFYWKPIFNTYSRKLICFMIKKLYPALKMENFSFQSSREVIEYN